MTEAMYEEKAPASLPRKTGLRAKLFSLSAAKKVLVLALVGLLVYAPILALERTIIRDALGPDFTEPDMGVYRARTETILSGGLLYTDTHTETPPLISYLLVPAQVLGGGDSLAYSLYFMFFGFLGGALLYLGLRRYDEKAAFIMALLYVVLPFGLVESANAEDETLVALTVLVPALLMLRQRKKWTAVATGLGIWTKMWAILLLPVQLLHLKTWRERFVHVGIIAAISAAVAGPFYYLCGDDFLWVIRYYFIGVEGRTAEGAGLFYFLRMGGYEVPAPVEFILVIAAVLAALWIAYRRKLGVWESITIMLVAFFLTYPKMHTGYFLIPLAFLLAWGAEDLRIAARCFLLYIPWMLAVGLSPWHVPWQEEGAVFAFDGSWMVGLALNIIIDVILVETTYRAMKKRPFMSRGGGEKSEEYAAAAPSD